MHRIEFNKVRSSERSNSKQEKKERMREGREQEGIEVRRERKLISRHQDKKMQACPLDPRDYGLSQHQCKSGQNFPL